MRGNSRRVLRIFLGVLCLWGLVPVLRAQDALPGIASLQQGLPVADTLSLYSARTDTIEVPYVALPACFRLVSDNILTDSIGLLDGFWEKLRMARFGIGDTVRVVHVGDSHVRGHIFPRTTGAFLQQTFGTVSYTDVGINGAACITFVRRGRLQQIADLHPDLLILSFGTNESHNRRYNATAHQRQMGELVYGLRRLLPGVPMLMTTPPGAYERLRTGGRRTYRVNPRTVAAVKNIHRFADANGLAVWDMYAVCGGPGRACLNWQEAGLMRRDHIHFLPAGYELQGRLLFQALLKAYNDYVEY